MSLDLIVTHEEREWSLTNGRERFSGFGSELAALRGADMLARDAELCGHDIRVMVRTDDGGLRLETRYGRRTSL